MTVVYVVAEVTGMSPSDFMFKIVAVSRTLEDAKRLVDSRMWNDVQSDPILLHDIKKYDPNSTRLVLTWKPFESLHNGWQASYRGVTWQIMPFDIVSAKDVA